MAALTKAHMNYNILINFDHPYDSTSWGNLNCDNLVQFDFPDGSTSLAI